MSPETIIAQLEQINSWRRGEESEPQPDPKHVGEVIDAAVASLRSLVASNTTLRRERGEARDEAKQRVQYKRCLDQRIADEFARHDLRALISAWESKLSAVMPADYKDWHENARSEWPEVAASTITRLRARVAEVEVQAERYRLATLRQDADLARATAERQKWKEWAEEARAMFHKQIDAAAVMKTRAEQAEQRVAELVAALREVDEIVNDANHSAEDRLCAAANRLLNTRAESATPDHIPDAAKMVSATPAKHPDADWLSVLDYATQALIRAIAKAGGEYKDTTFDDEWLCVSLAPPRRGDFQLGDLRRLVRSIAAIDAARKQGGEK